MNEDAVSNADVAVKMAEIHALAQIAVAKQYAGMIVALGLLGFVGYIVSLAA